MMILSADQMIKKIEEAEAKLKEIEHKLLVEINECKRNLLNQRKELLQKDIEYHSRCINALYGSVANQ